MLPPEHRTERNMRLQAKLDECNGELNRLDNLVPEDFRIIGAFIQMYNFMEFNCRRCIEIFAMAGLLTGRSGVKPQRTHSSEVVPTIKRVVEQMDPAIENIADSLAKLDEIELRRGFRNIFAHWAARRIPQEDAMALFSMDGFDERQISGIDRPLEDVARTVIFDLADIRGLIGHLVPYEQWLAAKASEWHSRLLPDRSGT